MSLLRIFFGYKKQIVILIWSLMLCNYLRLAAQTKMSSIDKQTPENTTQLAEMVNRNHLLSGGIFTDGWGLGYEYQFGKSTKTKKVIGIGITERVHPKEKSIDFKSEAFGNFSVVYGKQNICYPLNIYYGNILTLGGPNQEKGVSVDVFYNIGLSLALMRPYYITLIDTSDKRDPNKEVQLKYNSKDSLYFFNVNYYKSSPYFLGLREMDIVAGAHFGAGIDIGFGHRNASNTLYGIRAMCNLEYYIKPLEIMVAKPNLINNQFFLNGKLTLYLCINQQKTKFFKTK